MIGERDFMDIFLFVFFVERGLRYWEKRKFK
jgi:hypothetical protein